jgi:hypothetical protein
VVAFVIEEGRNQSGKTGPGAFCPRSCHLANKQV